MRGTSHHRDGRDKPGHDVNVSRNRTIIPNSKQSRFDKFPGPAIIVRKSSPRVWSLGMSIPTLIFRTIRWSAWDGCEAGMEHVDVRPADGGIAVSGVIIAQEEGTRFGLSYRLRLDALWHTRMSSSGPPQVTCCIWRATARAPGRRTARTGRTSRAASISTSRPLRSPTPCRSGGSA